MTTLSSIRNAAIEDAGAGGLTVYATKEDLPASGLTAGDQAYVSANSRLYVSNGSGWYNVALINATPSLSIDPTGTISLSTTGETTTITLTATDSDNAVAGLAYSVESDGSFGGLATLSQDSSVFTITPLSEDSATTSSAVLTFKASDGINFGSGDRTLTLSFKVENSNYTTLLLKNEETTDNQVDASTNALTITEYGNTTSTALSPYHPGGYSTYFDGTGDYLSVAYSADHTFGSGQFTVECWVYMTAYEGTGFNTFLMKTDGTNNDWQLDYKNGSTELRFIPYVSSSAETSAGVATATLALNTWHHIAVSRDGNNDLRLFHNGSLLKTTSYSSTIDADGDATLEIGARNTGGTRDRLLTGYVRDLRIVKGTAVYTSAFTPPIASLTAITNTSLLSCHLPYIADGSTNGHTITVNGNTSTKRLGPYDYLGYIKANHGGSVYFDGSGDYFQIPDGTYKDYGEDDFTFECWIYPTATGQNKYITSDYASSGQMTTQTFGLLLDNSILKCYIRVGGVNVIGGLNGSTTVQLNVWHHVALVRNGNVFTLYLDGESEVSLTQSGAVNDSTNPFTIGRAGDYPGLEYQGYVADARLVKGTAVYTAAFTPPTAPLTAITNTQLLTCTNKNDIWDATSGNLLTKAGNVTGGANSGTLKFGQTAIYFDGSGDNLTISDLAMGSGDCTFEFWMYQNIAQSAAYRCMLAASTYASGIPFTIYTYSSNVQVWLSSSGSAEISGAFTASTWHHIALVRNSGTWTLYIDGTSAGTSTTGGSYNFAATTDWRFGENHSGSYDWDGYIQDPRFTKGLARYTSNFTPPTAEFDG
ncbi:LamG domain-containing protein [bacterium]|nr:LamG domain-containing protein [bacterium]